MKRDIKRTVGALVCAGLLCVGSIAVSGCSEPTQEEKHEVTTKMTQLGEFPALRSFTAQTADGKEVTPENLASADATLAVVWSPADKGIGSLLKELGSWSKMLPSSVKVMTFCKDYEDGGAEVLKDSGYAGTTVVDGDGHYQEFVDEAHTTPMAVVLGSDGAVLDEPLAGVPNDLGASYAKLINQGLIAEGKTELNVAEL